MMEAIVARLAGVAPVSYDAARETVGRWHRAGVTILAGTDANQAASAPASPPYGTSLHHELRLLVDAGLSAFEALRSATALAAQQFGLADRGVIAPGKRADLVLIDGDPLAGHRRGRQHRGGVVRRHRRRRRGQADGGGAMKIVTIEEHVLNPAVARASAATAHAAQPALGGRLQPGIRAAVHAVPRRADATSTRAAWPTWTSTGSPCRCCRT